MKTILYANGTSENHGCEAIMQTTTDLLQDKFEKIYCSTTNLKYEKENTLLPNKCEWVEYSYYRKPSYFNRIISKTERTILKSNRYFEAKPWINNICDIFNECEIALSVGGDNYCNRSQEWLYMLHKEAKKKGLKTILWGASVDDSSLYNKEMRDDLLKYNIICARESLTYSIVSRFHPNVRIYPDPAFTLNTIENPWNIGEVNLDNKVVIGINASPTIMSYEKNKGIVIKNYEELIRYILKETNYYIALIPHVIYQKKWGDYQLLKILYDEFSKSKRVVLIEDSNCKVLKGYISRCKSFITARTHASIASYSSNVPTVVLGYSIKAEGIANDLFGSTEHYVVPVQEMDETNKLIKEFKWLEDNELESKKQLKTVIPKMIKSAESAVEVIDELV